MSLEDAVFDESLMLKPEKKAKPHPFDLQHKSVAADAHSHKEGGRMEKSHKMQAHDKRQARMQKSKEKRNKLPSL